MVEVEAGIESEEGVREREELDVESLSGGLTFDLVIREREVLPFGVLRLSALWRM